MNKGTVTKASGPAFRVHVVKHLDLAVGLQASLPAFLSPLQVFFQKNSIFIERY